MPSQPESPNAKVETKVEATPGLPIDPASFIKTKYSESRKTSSADFERFANYYKLFRNRQTRKNYTGLANLFVPEPYRIVRKKTAKLAGAIRSIKVRPEGSSDVQNAKPATQLLNFLRRKLNWWFTERAAIQESRITGGAWLKCVWLVNREEEAKPYKGFDISMESVDKIYLPPGATILDVFEGKLEYLIHEYECDYSTLASNPNYNAEQLKILKSKGGASNDPSPLEQARLMTPAKKQVTKSKYNVKEYWGKFRDNDQGELYDALIVTVDDSVVVRKDKNPYAEVLDNPIPFVPVVANPVAKETFAVGDIEPAESLFNELNDTRNQRMDTVTFNIDPPKEILKGANINKAQLVARRGWFFESSIPNGVRFIPPDMQGVAAAVNEEKIIRGDIQQVTGSLDFASGDVQGGVDIDTAKGTIIAKGEADVLTEDEVEVLKTCLRMLYRIVLAYSQTFLDRQFEIDITENGEEKFVQMDKTRIAGNFDLDIEMRTLQDKTTEQQLKLMFLNIAKTVPGAKIGKFFTDALEAFKDEVNIKDYYEEPQPTPPEPPKISISLKGDLNEAEVDEIYKTIPNVDPTAADPLMRESMREAMRGNLPENQKKVDSEMNVEERKLKIEGMRKGNEMTVTKSNE